MKTPERRRVQRLVLSRPMEATICSQQVTVVDLCLSGAGIVHAAPLQAGRLGRFELEAGGETISVIAEVVRCRFDKGKGGATEAAYHSGIRFHQGANDEMGAVKRLLTVLVSETLEAEKLARCVQFAASA